MRQSWEKRQDSKRNHHHLEKYNLKKPSHLKLTFRFIWHAFSVSKSVMELTEYKPLKCRLGEKNKLTNATKRKHRQHKISNLIKKTSIDITLIL